MTDHGNVVSDVTGFAMDGADPRANDVAWFRATIAGPVCGPGQQEPPGRPPASCTGCTVGQK